MSSAQFLPMITPVALANEAMPERPSPPAKPASRFLHPLWVALAAVLLAAGAQLSVRWHLPLPQCLWRKLIGLPCPTCGCTRSLLAWSHLDLATAFRFNPLFSALVVGLFLWLLVWSLEHVSGRVWIQRWRDRGARWPLGKLFVALAVANWLYLCLTLPR